MLTDARYQSSNTFPHLGHFTVMAWGGDVMVASFLSLVQDCQNYNRRY